MPPDFLKLARDWRDAADRLRATGVPEGHPRLGVWREAAWCHLMVARGRPDAALSKLRAVVEEATGLPTPAGGPAAPSVLLREAATAALARPAA